MTDSTLIAEATLPETLQRGLGAVREGAEPAARVVAVRDNFAVIAIGEMEAPAIYVEQTVGMYVRVPLTFPHAAPYGIITDPYLTRRDRAAIDRQHANHSNSQPVAELLGRSNLGFWSWDWSGMPLRRPEDLAAIVEWARKRIRQG